MLLDIARLYGVDHFDDNGTITGDDLDRAPQVQPASPSEPGDALLVRTGHMHFLRAGEKQRYSRAGARAVDAVDRLAA